MYRSYRPVEIKSRLDGAFNVWAYMPWPDEYLDNDPEFCARYLRSTLGWRAMGWQCIHVAKTFNDARSWAKQHIG